MTTRWSAQTHLKIHQNCGGHDWDEKQAEFRKLIKA